MDKVHLGFLSGFPNLLREDYVCLNVSVLFFPLEADDRSERLQRLLAHLLLFPVFNCSMIEAAVE